MIYEKVKALCKKKRMPICELERKAGLANGSISKWKVNTPSLTKAKKVADLLEISLDELAKEDK